MSDTPRLGIALVTPGSPRDATGRLPGSGYGDALVQVNVLDCVEELHAFGHRALERLASGDQTGTPRTLVDHRSAYRLGEIVLPGSAARVDQRGTTHVAVRDLITSQ